MTEEQINELADNLDCGLRCFVHPNTGTIVTTLDNSDHFPSEDNPINEIKENLENYLEIKKMDSNESFRLMSAFVETIENAGLRDKFTTVLARPNPFRNFKIEIDNSGPYRQKWFDFKKGQMIEWVKGQLPEKDS
jgi:hypothetical protein